MGRTPRVSSLLLLTLAACAHQVRPTPSSAPVRATASVVARSLPSVATPLPESASRVTFPRIARTPEPGWNVPQKIGFVEGEGRVSYLESESGDEVLSLSSLDLATGAVRVLVRAEDLVGKEPPPLSREEELRRERQRIKTRGITSYSWSKKGGRLLLPLGGDVFLREPDGRIRALTRTKEPELDAKICDTGERAGFVRGRELFVVDLASGKESALTRNAPRGVTRGQSDFNAQEEFGEPSGWWFSPDCKSVAYLEVDERRVEEVPILGFRGGVASEDRQRYPRAGGTNPGVKLFVVSLGAGAGRGAPRAIPLPDLEGSYLGHFTWEPSGEGLAFEASSRDQKTLSFVRADARTGAHVTRPVGKDERYVSMSPLHRLERSGELLALGLHEGHDHLELRDRNGVPRRELTRGPWDVTRIVAADEERQIAYVIATRESPLERHLYAVPLAGGEPERLTREPGVHLPVVDVKSGLWIDVHSARDRPPAVVVRKLTGELLRDVSPPRDPEIDALGLRPAQPVIVTTADGTRLHGALLPPRGQEPGRLYPAVVMVYGGPGVQTVTEQFAPRLLWQHLADRGFFVFQVDGRGSAGRGHAFASETHGRLGEVELRDQLEALETLKAVPGVDGERVGIYGHSYGGFLTLAAMLRAPGKYRAGVAGSPVVDWRSYDSGYTERYLGPVGPSYELAELSRHAGALQGKLLVMHALMDENVHFENTAKLVDALVAAQKPFDMFVFPGERHGYRSPAAKEWASRRVVQFFVDALQPPK